MTFFQRDTDGVLDRMSCNSEHHSRFSRICSAPNFSEHESEGRDLKWTGPSSFSSRIGCCAEDDAVGAVRTRVMNASFRKSKSKVAKTMVYCGNIQRIIAVCPGSCQRAPPRDIEGYDAWADRGGGCCRNARSNHGGGRRTRRPEHKNVVHSGFLPPTSRHKPLFFIFVPLA